MNTLCRGIILIVFVMWCGPASAGGNLVLVPTYPGLSSQDYSRPGWVITPGDNFNPTTIQPTLPGISGVMDYSRLGYVIEPDDFGHGQVMYRTLPGTDYRDYSEPGFRIDTDAGASW